VEVSGPALSAAARLDLADLPERQRTALERAFRAELVALWLTEAERRLLALGAEPLVEVIRMALVRSVAVLERDRSSSALARALDLATLYENLGRYAPFEAQTLFYRVWASAPAAEAEALAPLARTLGFVDHITRLG
jgi:hypothetical protein